MTIRRPKPIALVSFPGSKQMRFRRAHAAAPPRSIAPGPSSSSAGLRQRRLRLSRPPHRARRPAVLQPRPAGAGGDFDRRAELVARGRGAAATSAGGGRRDRSAAPGPWRTGRAAQVFQSLSAALAVALAFWLIRTAHKPRRTSLGSAASFASPALPSTYSASIVLASRDLMIADFMNIAAFRSPSHDWPAPETGRCSSPRRQLIVQDYSWAPALAPGLMLALTQPSRAPSTRSR